MNKTDINTAIYASLVGVSTMLGFFVSLKIRRELAKQKAKKEVEK